MSAKVQITFGGADRVNGDFTEIRRIARTGGTARWACGKETKKGDRLLFYFQRPHSGIIASALTQRDARPGKHWRYDTRIGKATMLASAISIAELREMFPGWRWLNYPRSYQYLKGERARKLLKRAGLLLKTPPVAITVSGGGFGTWKNNRLVENAARRKLKAHYRSRGFKVVSREKENIGYDFDVSKAKLMLHVELKGISGSSLKFPITANEVKCAALDSSFHLAVVTNARRKPRVRIFTGKEFLSGFERSPLAFIAEAKE